MARRLALLASLVIALPAVAVPGDRPWTSDDILGLRVVSDPQVSPDGRLVAYVVESLNGEKDAYQTDVWLVPAAGGEARALASSPVGDDTPRWSPDGRWVAFLSERPRPGVKADDAGEAKRQVWLIRPDGGEAAPLTEAPGSVSDFEWSADGKTIAFLAREPKSDDRKRREKEKDDAWTPSEVYPWSRLWVIDVATRQARQLTTGEIHVTGMSLSPDGRTIALRRPAHAAHPGRLPLRPLHDPGRRRRPRAPRRAEGHGQRARLVARREVGRLRLPGRPRRRLVHQQLGLRRPRGGRRPPDPDRVPRRADRGPLRLAARVESGQRGPSLSRRSAHRHPRLPGDARRKGGADHQRRRGEWRSLGRRPGRDARLPAGGLDHAARGVGDAARHGPGGEARERPPLRGRGGAAPKALTDTNPQARERLSFPKERVTWKGALGWDMEGLLVSAGLREGHSCPPGPQRPRRPGGRARELVHPGDAPLGLAALRTEGLRDLLPEPSWQRRLRGEVPRRQRARLGCRGLRGPDEGRRRSGREGDRRPRPIDRDRLVLRRLHDLHDRHEDRPLQVGDRGGGGDGPRLLHRHRRHARSSRSRTSPPGPGTTRRSTSSTRPFSARAGSRRRASSCTATRTSACRSRRAGSSTTR